MNQFSKTESNLDKQYASYQNVLKGAKKGEVVTRFPPEPSGFLHVGHVKAALLNYHYSRIYEGKMLLRFDDTNPSKEKQEYVDNIVMDLKTLGVNHDGEVSHTSDHFEYLLKVMTDLISQGRMYSDNTEHEQMKKERMDGIESKHRDKSVEDNLAIWDKMQKGEADDYCIRVRLDMKALNKCLRDPVMYRINRTPHHRTGTKYLVYPTYDFCCPLVDSLEGVTHALRSSEYQDRNVLYNNILDMTGVRRVNIFEFSRLNLVNVVLSKRKLQWFVESGRVEGWNDPRFPTLQGVMRRGLTQQTLTEFMLEQGPSRNMNLMEWDKLWATNKKIIDPIAERYFVISQTNACVLKFTNHSQDADIQTVVIPKHPQNPGLGDRVQYRGSSVFLEFDDAKDIQEGEKITLMRWGNCKITKIEKSEGESLMMEAELMPDDKDFKKTKKMNWVSRDSPYITINLVEYDHLMKCKKLEEGQELENHLNEQTEFISKAYAEPIIKELNKGHIIQFERRGYYIYDQDDKQGVKNYIYIPDGKNKAMSTISTKVDVAKFSGTKMEDKPKKEEDESKEKSKKQLKREKAEAEKAKKREQHKLNDQKKKDETEQQNQEKKKEDE